MSGFRNSGRVLQGYFRSGRFVSVPPKAGARTAQPQARGNAQPLPDGILGNGSGGKPLPPAVRTKMESFFGADLSDVRLHVGREAPAIGALAFTLGSDLYFAPGQLNLDSHHGHELLGHELTHVIQQRAGRVRNPFNGGVAVVQDPALEAEADRMGRLAAAHRPAVQKKAAPTANGQKQPLQAKSAGPRVPPPPTRYGRA
jgi:hypothetical protein